MMQRCRRAWVLRCSSERQCISQLSPAPPHVPRLACLRPLHMASGEHATCVIACLEMGIHVRGCAHRLRRIQRTMLVISVLMRWQLPCAGMECRARTPSDWRRRCGSMRRRGSSRSATCCTTWWHWRRPRCSLRKVSPPRVLWSSSLSPWLVDRAVMGLDAGSCCCL